MAAVGEHADGRGVSAAERAAALAAGCAADVYSYGMLLYLMAAGEMPFAGEHLGGLGAHAMCVQLRGVPYINALMATCARAAASTVRMHCPSTPGASLPAASLLPPFLSLQCLC